MRILLTGCAGFIGSHACEEFIKNDIPVVGVDCLTYAGNLQNLENVKSNKSFRFFREDISNHESILKIVNHEKVTHILNFAAQTHVDNSIKDVFPFIHSNISGVASLLEVSKKTSIPLVHVSTDEVYGVPSPGQTFTENSPLNPRNPYSATKAAADHLVISAINTHKVDAKIIRPSNNFGPRQHREKFIPTILRSIRSGKKIPVYGDGMQLREWTYVKDTAMSMVHFFKEYTNNNQIVYNLTSEYQISNIDVIRKICQMIDVDYLNQVEFIDDRPGHDREYKIRNSILKSNTDFLEAIKQTIEFEKNQEN